jgi:hypothetical protein
VILCNECPWSREETAHADIVGCPKLAIDASRNIQRRQIEFTHSGYYWQCAFRKRRDGG